MLKKINRLTKKKDFEKVFKRGGSAYNRIISVKTVANLAAATRFGIIISTKVDKKAVVRNKIRRWIRETIKEELGEINKGFDVVIIVSPMATQTKKEEIKALLVNNLKRLKVLS